MTGEPHPQRIKQAIRIDKPYNATALEDGWLCIKYLDCGEESLSTFADISKGDIILWGNATRTHSSSPAPVPEPTNGGDPWNCTDLGIECPDPEQEWCNWPCDIWLKHHDEQIRQQAATEEREKVLAKIDNLDCETCKDYHTSECPIWCSRSPRACIDHSLMWGYLKKLRATPREIPIGMNSTDILLLAHDEWKRREERKHIHPEDHWVSGFVGGFLTDRKWARDYVASLRREGEQP